MSIVRPDGGPKGFRRADFKIIQNEFKSKNSFSMSIQITRKTAKPGKVGGFQVVTGNSMWDQARKREEE
jgi:hypothetical protein